MFAFTPVARVLVTVALAFCALAKAQASSLSVTPIMVTLDDDNRSAVITVKNGSNEPRVIQTELLRWTQENGENRYAPSNDILVNPPLAVLQPGQSQIVRVGLNSKRIDNQELAYRLYIGEVPPQSAPGVSGVRVALRFGLAVFATPQSATPARPTWKAARSRDGSLQLNLDNAGNRHLRLANLRVIDPASGKQLSAWQRAPITVLAGQARRLQMPLPAEWKGTQLRLLSDTEGEPIETQLQLDPPGQSF